MASVDKDTLNDIAKTTDVHASPSDKVKFDGEFVFGVDAFPHSAKLKLSAMRGQDIDGAYGRALNKGRGVVGEGDDAGPGVVGIAGDAIANPDKPFPRPLSNPPSPGRGWRVGVIGFGADPDDREGRSDALGVMGFANKSVGVLGWSFAHAGVYGNSATIAVFGDASAGHIGVEGVGNSYGVYGHVKYSDPNPDGVGVFVPNPDGVGVFGAAYLDLNDLTTYIGRAGVFSGPVDVIGDVQVTGNAVVYGTKSAAVKHTDGTHRLLYCIESPESQFEDFGEAKLVRGRAQVRLDRDFATLADTRQYHVFVTPYGDCNGLYVGRRSRNAFEVREQGGGTGSVSFSYRVVAKRKNVTTKRFQKVVPPKRPKIPAALARPEIDLDAPGSRPAPRKRPKASES